MFVYLFIFKNKKFYRMLGQTAMYVCLFVYLYVFL